MPFAWLQDWELFENNQMNIKKRGSPKSWLLCQKCAKTHLRASVVPKKFFRLAIARHEGEGERGKGRGREGGGGEGGEGKEEGGERKKGGRREGEEREGGGREGGGDGQDMEGNYATQFPGRISAERYCEPHHGWPTGHPFHNFQNIWYRLSH